MRTKTKTQWFLALFMLMVCVGITNAYSYVGKDYAGATCQDTAVQKLTLPSAAYASTMLYKCEGDMDACVYVFKDSNLKVVAEIPLQAGESTKAPYTAFFAEKYSCYVGQATCGGWTNGICGGWGGGVSCQQYEMLQTKSCQKSVMFGGDKYLEGQCLSSTQCAAAKKCTPSVGEWGSCTNSKQSRTVTYSTCGTLSESQACAVGCTNPVGKAGQSRYDNPNTYVCNGLTAKWEKVVADSDSSDSSSSSGSNDGSSSGSTGSTGSTTGTGTTTLEEPDIKLVSAGAVYDKMNGMVISRFSLFNYGGDMKDTYLVEMQVRATSG